MDSVVIEKFDKKYKFLSTFNSKTGFYIRSGILDGNGRDTGKEPFMASFPELLDIGIMETCVCATRCKIDCYQKAIERKGKDMSVRNFENILKQCEGKTFQVALGGAGDPDTHMRFEDILRLCRKYNVVPNFTTSGIAMNNEKAELCKEYCGAVAVSEHFANYTDIATDMLLKAGVKTNLHYVLGKNTIDEAIRRLKNDSFHKGINAVVFLLYKPIGLGKDENVLTVDDHRVEEFFDLIDQGNFRHKIGFDSCTCPGILNFTKKISRDTMDYCEGGRFSAYIDASMHMMPCSFANQDSKWFVDIDMSNPNAIEEAWNGPMFDRFRHSLIHSCSGCEMRDGCGGGCSLVNKITLCNRKERNFIGG